jgi:hypothetical protein
VTGTVVPLARTADQLQNLLEDAALRRGEFNWPLIRAVAYCGHTSEQLTEAWDDFREAVRARELLATGMRTWQEFYDPEDCSGHEHAIELKSAEVDDAYRRLIHGPRVPIGEVGYGEVGFSPAVIHLKLECEAIASEYGVRPFRIDAEAVARFAAGRFLRCRVCFGAGAR